MLAACYSAYLRPLARGSWGLLLGHGFRHPVNGVALEESHQMFDDAGDIGAHSPSCHLR